MRDRVRRLGLMRLVVLAFSSAAWAAPVLAENGRHSVRYFDIPAQKLDDALDALASQTGRQIVYFTDDIAETDAPEIHTWMTEKEALATLLEGSGLVFRYINDDLIAITPIGSGQAPPTTTPSFPVFGDRPLRLKRVHVAGFRETFLNAAILKRQANQVSDAILAEEMQRFPDLNVAEAAQRVAGVQITRNNGEGESISIRGLSADFTRIEIDGRSTAVTINSQNPMRQSVLSVFSSNLYKSVEVIKSPTAKDVEGAVAGIVRLKTPDPFDIGQKAFGAETGIVWREPNGQAEPLFSGYYNNVFADGRIGTLIAGTFERRDQSLDKLQSNHDWLAVDESLLADPEDPDLLALIGARYPGRLRQEIRKGEAPNFNINAKLQFQAAPTLLLRLDGILAQEQRIEQRSRIQVQFSSGLLTSGTVDPNTGTLITADFLDPQTDFMQFDRKTDIETYGITGGFLWSGKFLTVDGAASFSSSKEDRREIRAGNRTATGITGGYTLSDDPAYPALYTNAINVDTSDLALTTLDFDRRVISITEESTRFDAERGLTASPFASFTFGARLARTTFDRRQGQSTSSSLSELSYADGTTFLSGERFADGYGGQALLRNWPSVDPAELFRNYPSDTPFTFNDGNVFSIEERSLAGYAQANLDAHPGHFRARGNFGARIVGTKYTGTGRLRVVDPDQTQQHFDDTPSLNRTYWNILPAFNLVLSHEAQPDIQVRASASRTLSRPGIDALTPVVRIGLDDMTVTRGNPDLDPYRAWQYDLGAEWYFGPQHEGLFSAFFFYKDIDSFIFETTTPDVSFSLSDYGVTETVFDLKTYENGGNARVSGLELGLQAPFSFLPDPWSGLGAAINYTYTDSRLTDMLGDSQPFPGASENAFNIVTYYDRGPLSVRLAYNFRDDYLIVPASEEDDGSVANAQYGAAQGRLDLAFRLRLKNGLRISFDALNLTGEQNYKYYDIPQRLEDLDVEGQVFAFKVGRTF